jgi:hypothetical protein
LVLRQLLSPRTTALRRAPTDRTRTRKSPGICFGALARALSRQEDVEGDNVTVDRVVHDQIAVIAELDRVGGKAHCVVIDNLKVSAVDLLAVLIV